MINRFIYEPTKKGYDFTFISDALIPLETVLMEICGGVGNYSLKEYKTGEVFGHIYKQLNSNLFVLIELIYVGVDFFNREGAIRFNGCTVDKHLLTHSNWNPFTLIKNDIFKRTYDEQGYLSRKITSKSFNWDNYKLESIKRSEFNDYASILSLIYKKRASDVNHSGIILNVTNKNMINFFEVLYSLLDEKTRVNTSIITNTFYKNRKMTLNIQQETGRKSYFGTDDNTWNENWYVKKLLNDHYNDKTPSKNIFDIKSKMLITFFTVLIFFSLFMIIFLTYGKTKKTEQIKLFLPYSPDVNYKVSIKPETVELQLKTMIDEVTTYIPKIEKSDITLSQYENNTALIFININEVDFNKTISNTIFCYATMLEAVKLEGIDKTYLSNLGLVIDKNIFNLDLKRIKLNLAESYGQERSFTEEIIKMIEELKALIIEKLTEEDKI